MSTTPDPTRQTSHPIPQEAFDWYDEYAHGMIDRRTFMKRLSTLSSGAITIAMLSSALLPNYAAAEQIPADDPDIKATDVDFASPKGHGECRGYLVTPSQADGKLPAVLVIHENRGLNPYVKDVARRLAKAGFIALAPDALHPLGGYPGNDDKGREMQKSMDAAKLEQDFIAAARYLKALPSSNGKLGAVGFCYGGYIVNMLAATLPDDLNAGVAFYGTPAAKEIRKNIKAPMLIQMGELDQRVNGTWPEYEQDLKAAGVDYTAHVYPGANHGFHNDSTGRYDKTNAELAWTRTLAFFGKNLK